MLDPSYGYCCERKIQCNACETTFTRQRDRARHEKTVHQGDTQFHCDHCHKSFSRKDSKLRHERNCSARHYERILVSSLLNT